MPFTVRNLTEDRQVEVIYIELDNDHALSSNDQIYILEKDRSGELMLTWLIYFSGYPTSALPQPGDEFLLAILKPFTHRDVFQFTTGRTAVDDGGTISMPRRFRLYQNYPNPFNPSITIQYQVPEWRGQPRPLRPATQLGAGEAGPGSGMSDPIHTTLKVFNILGEKVVTLVDEDKETGYYTIIWDGRDALGNEVPSGVYFYRIKGEVY